MDGKRYPALDGWRGISILLVLMGHLLPLGPHRWELNAAAATSGMAIFFTLSGFLITTFLLHNNSVIDFLLRRFFRIVPIAWICMAIVLPISDASLRAYVAHFLFYANLPPIQLTEVGAHLWSLCVEVQFYVGVALLFWMLGIRALLLLPLLCLLVTAFRVISGSELSIVTWLRIDEIFAGATLALAYGQRLGPWPSRILTHLNPYLLLALLVLSSHPEAGPINYLRPYAAAVLVGATLYRPAGHLGNLLASRALAYMAAVSYALYVFHPVLSHSWLGDGDKLVKYLKRPLLVAALFLVAHISTFHFEKPCIRFGKALARKLSRRERTEAVVELR